MTLVFEVDIGHTSSQGQSRVDIQSYFLTCAFRHFVRGRASPKAKGEAGLLATGNRRCQRAAHTAASCAAENNTAPFPFEAWLFHPRTWFFLRSTCFDSLVLLGTEPNLTHLEVARALSFRITFVFSTRSILWTISSSLQTVRGTTWT